MKKSELIALALSASLLAGCTMDALNEAAGFNSVSESVSGFDGYHQLHLSAGIVPNGEGSNWTANAFSLTADWLSNAPDFVRVEVVMQGIAGVSSLEANFDGNMKNYPSSEALTNFKDGAIGQANSEKGFLVPVADLRSWQAAKRVVLRVGTSAGAIEGYYSFAPNNATPLAKMGMAKLLAKIDAQPKK